MTRSPATTPARRTHPAGRGLRPAVPSTPSRLSLAAPPSTLAGRCLHLVDVENLGVELPGGPVPTGTGERYRRLTEPTPTDQFLVGADVSRVFDMRREFPGARHCTGRGPDGAEHAILATLDPELLSERFAGLTVASGDWRFAGIAGEARRRGLWVRVVSRRDRLARVLGAAADEVVEFDPDATTLDPPTAGVRRPDVA